MRVAFVFMTPPCSASTDHETTVGGGAFRVVHRCATRCVIHATVATSAGSMVGRHETAVERGRERFAVARGIEKRTAIHAISFRLLRPPRLR